jgi:hypothetical protein
MEYTGPISSLARDLPLSILLGPFGEGLSERSKSYSIIAFS